MLSSYAAGAGWQAGHQSEHCMQQTEQGENKMILTSLKIFLPTLITSFYFFF